MIFWPQHDQSFAPGCNANVIIFVAHLNLAEKIFLAQTLRKNWPRDSPTRILRNMHIIRPVPVFPEIFFSFFSLKTGGAAETHTKALSGFLSRTAHPRESEPITSAASNSHLLLKKNAFCFLFYLLKKLTLSFLKKNNLKNLGIKRRCKYWSAGVSYDSGKMKFIIILNYLQQKTLNTLSPMHV